MVVGPKEFDLLKSMVHGTSRKRISICTHKDVNDPLHEMFVCYTKETSVGIHKHVGKDESFQVLEGELSFILYNDHQDVDALILMQAGDYVRVPKDRFHSIVLHSVYCILKVTTTGPFERDKTVWA